MQHNAGSVTPKRITVRAGGRIHMVDVDQISYIEGAGNYSHIHLNDGDSLCHRLSLSAMHACVETSDFMRIHRSLVVRSKAVKEIKTSDKADYVLIMQCGTELPLSRRYKSRLQALLT